MPGVHLTIDMYECKGFELQDPKLLESLLSDAINLANMKLVKLHEPLLYEDFDSYLGWGWSIIAILAESHATVHTAPSKNRSAFFDIYSCMSFIPDDIVDFLIDKLKPNRYEKNIIFRNRLLEVEK